MPHIEWRGGTCRVKWWTGDVYENGRRRYESLGGFTDEGEALDYGLDREADVRNKRFISRRDGSVLMRDYCEQWYATLDLAPLSMRKYRYDLDAHVIPHWGNTPIGEITATQYRAWQKHVRSQVADTTAVNVFARFAAIMDDAVADGLRTASPVKRRRRRGRYKKKPREKKRDLSVATVHQIARNADAYWGQAGYAFFLTMAFTGMRPGELYGLRREFCHPLWPASDPDGERRQESLERYASDDPLPAIRVEWQHQYVDGEPTLLPPKYESYRTLVVPSFLAELLEKLLASHDSEWVFPSISGGPLVSTNFTVEYWRRLADGQPERRGAHVKRPLDALPAVPALAGKRMYLIRHGAKEWLDEDGHSRIAAEARMGHEVAGVEGLYSNVTVAMERAIATSLQARWERYLAEWEATGR